MAGDPGVRDPAARFAADYQRLVDMWPVPVTQRDLPTAYGATHVLACGPADAPPVLMLPGGGATAAAWRDVAAGLSAACRVVAVDPIGQPGLSVPGASPITSSEDLSAWLDQVLDALAFPRAALVGHSYGAWMALRYAVRVPARVSRLVLLDPTDVFAPMSLRYRLRAVPLLARPGATRMRRFLDWETRGRPLDQDWLALVAAGQDLGRTRIVLPRRPAAGDLAGLHLPVLVVVAGRSRAHNPRRIALRAGAWLPDASVATLAQASHHTVPVADTGELLDRIAPFLSQS